MLDTVNGQFRWYGIEASTLWIKKLKKLKELIEEFSVFNDNNFKIVKVNTKVN